LPQRGASAPGHTRSSVESRQAPQSWSSLPRGFHRNQQIERDAYELGSRDMNAAWQQLQNIEDPADRAAFIRGFFAADARLPAGEAVAWINKFEDRSERSLAMQTVAAAWRGGVPARMETRRGMALNEEASLGMSLIDGSTARAELALAWAEGLVRQGPERAALLGAVAAALTLKDPARAVALAETTKDNHDGEIFRAAYADALREVAGESAWRQAGQLPPGRLRGVAQRSILATWGRADPARAIAVLDELTSGEERNGAIATIAEAWAGEDTEAALAWAATMQGQQHDIAAEAINRIAPVGIGAVLDSADGYPVIRDLVPGGPADRSNLIPRGSVITAITDANGVAVSTKGMELNEFVGKARGRQGTTVTLFVQAPGTTSSQPVMIMRQQLIHKTAAK